ncbi:MAG: hypothetical protein CL858_04975 [Cupriavidus sp.]|uniref:hypothetical protein n=1 Tax=Cupriavidus TaxID=106589 RepID=UPI000C6962B0|nr:MULTISPECIES: hypothetical protein [Cupriavidus]KAB0600379.1 hypothetical protein F7R19_21470 [Cupriavidus pauculus]MBU64802.1 hypothetical protein [Cupriavidus sp.]MBY4733453.1 hypothetical protein [Cupriavidus pauculus]UAL03810.1 hypothetical protein K8O84_28195 [Cupriavidus pauculus]
MKQANSPPSRRATMALARLQAAATLQGLACHATVWQGVSAKILLECANGHRFERRAYGVLYKAPGCPECSRASIAAKFDKLVADRGGQCLTDGGFLGGAALHRIRCKHGHEWNPEGRSVLAGYWCPRCAGKPTEPRPHRQASKYGLADLHAKAAEHGGKCLAAAWKTGRDHYPFECAAGHRWEAMGYKVLKQGNWCRTCTDTRLGAQRTDADGLARIQGTANERGGRCLSTAYHGTSAFYRFRCAAGHEWEALGNNVLQGGWCRICRNEGQKLGIEAMHALARERGGICLSDTYRHGKAKLKWECHRGHVWDATPSGVKAGHWCPSCAILNTIVAKNQHKRKRYEAVGKAPD